MLIALQRPEATHVAGYNKWKELGRQVKKGEKGIAILAPCTYKRKADQNQPNTANHPISEPTNLNPIKKRAGKS